VSSLAHRHGTIKRGDINSEQSYNPFLAYAQSKLANVLFTRALAGRLKDTQVTVNALHPGTINTELTRYMNGVSLLFNQILLKPCLFLFFKTAAAGAQTSIYAGTYPRCHRATY
jgi:NAD(P)-dependent dehydrogenase (short-subunit alcohol dehydrogenase family)